MTPHYEWTPASEPPDTDRKAITWLATRKDWRALRYQAQYWSFNGHWRDIDPPKKSAE